MSLASPKTFIPSAAIFVPPTFLCYDEYMYRLVTCRLLKELLHVANMETKRALDRRVLRCDRSYERHQGLS